MLSGRHVDALGEDHRVGHGLAAALVEEAHREDGLADLGLLLHELEAVVLGVGRAPGSAVADRAAPSSAAETAREKASGSRVIVS